MADNFISQYIEDLLKNIRTQVTGQGPPRPPHRTVTPLHTASLPQSASEASVSAVRR